MLRKELSKGGAPVIWKWALVSMIAVVVGGLLLVVNGSVSAAVPTGQAPGHNAKPANPSTTNLVISQMYGGGGNSGAPWHNDFVEIFNPTASSISFTNWSIQYASAAGTSWQVSPITGTLAPGQYYLVQEGAGTGGGNPLPNPDAFGTINMSATAGKVALVNSITPLGCGSACHADPSVVDYIGFGATANDYEGTGPAPAPSNTSSDLRANFGCQDTDSNANDFTVATTIDPHNTSSPTHPCGGTPGITNTPAPTFTPSVTPTAYPTCGTGSDYAISSSTGATLVPGTTDIGNHCSACTTAITLPFTVNLYGIPFNTVNASSNGNLQFASSNSSFTPVCLPTSTFNYTIFALWADQDTSAGTCPACGIFTSVTGSAPNRVFNVEWRTIYFATSTHLDYEVQLLENSNQFNVIYDTAPANTSFQATIGVQRATGISYTQFYCGTDNGEPSGLELTFQPLTCGQPTFTPTSTPTLTATATAYPTCGSGSDYIVIPSMGATIVPGTDDTGNHCSECTTAITLPFPVNLYGIPFNTVNASNTGNLQFLSTNGSFSPVCLPTDIFNYAIVPYWTDQNTVNTGSCTTCGIFTSVTGSAPNRVFNIEWRTVYYGTVIPVDYEVQFFEGQDLFNIIYGSAPDNGSAPLTIGVQRSTGLSYTQYYCGSTSGEPSGLELTFRPYQCGEPTFTPTATATATNTPTPVPTCGTGSDYVIAPSTGATLVPGTTDIGNHCNNCTTAITLPFTFNFYGLPFNTANVSSKGNIQFLTQSTAFSNACLPTSTFNYALMPYWDDLQTVSVLTSTVPTGVFTSISGSAPNRVFNIEWRACVSTGGPNPPACNDTDTNFEVRLHESTSSFDYVYGAMAQNGSGATVGVQRGFGQTFTQFSCNTASLSSGLQLTFQTLPCSTSTPTPTATGTSGNTLIGHVTLQGIAQPNARNVEPITLTLCVNGTSQNFVSTLDNSGFFTVTTGLPNGTYNYRVKPFKNLANAGTLALNGGTTNVEMGLLRAGDSDNNNQVNTADFTRLKAAFGTTNNPNTDFNNDGQTNTTDFTLLKGNFGQAGASLTCP